MDAAPSIDHDVREAAHEPSPSTPAEPAFDGEVRFVGADAFAAQVTDLRAKGALVVRVGLFGARPGTLAERAEAEVEEMLRGKGAGAPGLGAEADPCAILADQLFRARRLGFRGLALMMPALRPLALRLGALDATDAAHLRFLHDATKDRPLVLVLSEEERLLPVFARTVPLEDHLDPLVDVVDEGFEPDDELLFMNEVATGTPTVDDDEASASNESPTPPAGVPRESEALAAAPLSIPDPLDSAVPSIPPPPAVELTPVSVHPIHVISEPEAELPEPAIASAPPAPDPEPVRAEEPAPEPVRIAPPPPPVPVDVAPAFVAPSDPTEGKWKTWATALTAARGPQTLAAFERLFAQSYLPLATALDAGLREPKARLAREEFAKNFARAYSESFPTFALTGKRPKLVLDAYDVAARMARLHGARTTHLLLVDGMRYDVAARVTTQVLANLSGRASLVDRITIFSALPTITARQLETLARGPISLAQQSEADDDEPIRDRTAETVRRIKVGSRDVYKLDLLEARLKNSHDHAMSALAAIEDECTAAIVKHARTLPPRTLLLVFGDHGFRFDDEGAAVQGGATPEEVILSAYGLLVGELH